MKNRSKWIWGGICLFVLIITIIVFIFRETILLKAGKFMAPTGDYKADVAILEGAEFIRTGTITSGMDLLSSGKVKRIIIVLQNIAPAHRPYGINGNYPDIVKQKLKDLGLKETQFQSHCNTHQVSSHFKRGGSGIGDSLEGEYKERYPIITRFSYAAELSGVSICRHTPAN